MMRIIFKSVFRPPPWIFRIYIESTDTLQAAIGTDRQINLSIFYSYDDKGISTLYHPLRPPPPPPPLNSILTPLIMLSTRMLMMLIMMLMMILMMMLMIKTPKDEIAKNSLKGTFILFKQDDGEGRGVGGGVGI